jgi:hypothetical protein
MCAPPINESAELTQGAHLFILYSEVVIYLLKLLLPAVAALRGRVEGVSTQRPVGVGPMELRSST